VGDQLTSAQPIGSKTQAVNDIIESAFQDRQQLLAGVFRGARGQFKVATELAFENAVKALEFLFLAQPDAIFARLAAARVHTGRLIAALNRALGGVATGAFQEQLDAFPAAHLAFEIESSCHNPIVFSFQFSVFSFEFKTQNWY
jgi:hypothetical protein